MTTPSDNDQAKASRDEVTNLLRSWGRGEEDAANRLLAVIYDDLHAQAARAMRREGGEHTLQATALVHEAYLRLVDQKHVDWKNRAHFFAIAAQSMRRVLVDHARGRLAEKRGGGVEKVTLSDAAVGSNDDDAVDVLALHDALERLAALDPDQARVVELRYFGGMNIDETAEALGISAATVKREWAVARAWLKRELSER
jgi:RNA polymerase sigma factor (TIGR02999 family)